MRKPFKTVRCTLLTGSSRSTEKKYIGGYKGTFDIFLGIGRRMRKEKMEEQVNKELKQGWRRGKDH